MFANLDCVLSDEPRNVFSTEGNSRNFFLGFRALFLGAHEATTRVRSPSAQSLNQISKGDFRLSAAINPDLFLPSHRQNQYHREFMLKLSVITDPGELQKIFHSQFIILAD